MSELDIRGLSKHFGQVVALEQLDLSLPSGKLICFLGPSGCGKTTLLRLIAGLETPSSGHILWGGQDLVAMPAHRRGIGMVFQSFALFPHLNVAENVAYGLRIRKVGKRQRLAKADELLRLVKLEGLGQRRISQLSGGQRQRVAMARALALEPSLFLLDEPLSALDAKLREAMQVEIKLLQQRLGITTIIVTHDQREAMTMADVIVVMGHNRVQQVGPPAQVYARPSNRFVADFLGSNNLLPATVRNADSVTLLGATLAAQVPKGMAKGTEVTLAIRPEKVRMYGLQHAEAAALALRGQVRFVRDVGAQFETFVRCLDRDIVVTSPAEAALHPALGDEVALDFPAEACVILEADSQHKPAAMPAL